MKKAYTFGLAGIFLLGAVAFITRDTPQEKEAKYLRRGNDFFEKGEYKNARIAYKNAAKIMPTDPEISYRWGLVDEAEGDIRNALSNFLYAEQQNPHYHPPVLKIAHYHLVSEQYDEVQKRIDEVEADSPDDPEAHALKAALFLRQKDFAGTEKEARFALSKDPANITAVSVLTGLYLAQGDKAKAGEMVNEGIARNPKDLSLLMLKVRLYEELNDLPKIAETYQAIFALKPNDAQFHMLLADTYVKAKKLDEAEAALRAGIAAVPGDWEIKRQLVTFLGTYRSVDASEKEIRGYMQAFPEKDDLYFWLADLYLAHDATDKAIALLEKIVSKDQTDKQSLNARTSLARIHFVKGNKELAEKMVNAVLEKVPSNAEALFIRANMSADQGLYQNAVSDLRIIIRDQPQNKEALQLLSEVLLLQGYTDLAIETLSQLMDLDPGNLPVRVRLAQMYNMNGDSKRALELLTIVTNANPQYPVGWESTARIAISIKDFALAKAAIAKLDAIEGQHMTATFLEGQLDVNNDKKDEALSSYTKVIDADPSSSLAEHALYSLVESHHSPAELEATAQYIASLKTDSPYVSTILGECYTQLGKLDLATAAFDKAIAHNPTSQDPYIDRAKLYMKEQKTDEALALLIKAASIVPTDVRAQLIQGDILNRQEKYKEAIAIYESLLTRNPALDLAANNMASIIADHLYADPAMLEKAGKAAERFLNSTNPLNLDTLGWVYYRQNNLDKALVLLSKVMDSAKPEDKIPLEMHYHYGAILFKTGNKAQAKAELLKATAPDANYNTLEEAKKLLKSI